MGKLSALQSTLALHRKIFKNSWEDQIFDETVGS